MNILAFVDAHGSLASIKKIIRKSKEADLLICAGDLTNWGKGLKFLIKRLLITKKDLLIIHGNHELPSDFINIKINKFHYIHRKQFLFKSYTFFGFGGGGFSLRDLEFEKTVKKLKFNKNLISITHAPPFHTKLDKLPHCYCGNRSIRTFIEKNQPVLHICGHLHENERKKDKIGNTLIINPGHEGMLVKL